MCLLGTYHHLTVCMYEQKIVSRTGQRYTSQCTERAVKTREREIRKTEKGIEALCEDIIEFRTSQNIYLLPQIPSLYT